MTTKYSVSYFQEINKDYSVEVKAWFDGKWNWNIYAHIFDSFPKYNDNQYLLDLPMAGGCTFDRLINKRPIEGIKYDFQKVTENKVIGCDFAHSWDDYDNHPSPFECEVGVIPHPFLGAARELVKALDNAVNNAREATKQTNSA